MSNRILESFNLSKVYELKGKNKFIKALDSVNFSINEGEIFGILGPNGSGKTTLIQILTTIIQPTSGTALVNGYDILKSQKKVRNCVALMLESKGLYHRITAYDNLKFFCRIYNIPNYHEKILEAAKELELDTWLNQYTENLSSGMRMKLALCRTLLLNRKIMFLDEPTLGIDIKTKLFIVKKLIELNKTIFLASHDMSVVEQLCNRIAYLNKGKILNIGTKEDLKSLVQSEIKIDIEIIKKKSLLKNELKNQDFIINIDELDNRLIITIKNREHYQELLLSLSKYKILKITEKELSLNDLFLKLF